LFAIAKCALLSVTSGFAQWVSRHSSARQSQGIREAENPNEDNGEEDDGVDVVWGCGDDE
jgi:hypothetical protein